METEFRLLTYDEQRDRGIDFPRGNCPVCTISYRITVSHLMYRHGPKGSPCLGTHEVASGLTHRPVI